MNENDQLIIVEKYITKEKILEYANASGDFNPIHINNDFAQKSQFGQVIAHGMMIAASISEMMTINFKNDWIKSGKLKLKFKSPVFDKEKIIVSGEINKIKILENGKEITSSVQVKKESGEIVITGNASVIQNIN
ncbi:MAG: hypothetical protein CL758_02275 [Chloroflexi bacterium]|nr:hypothetical protein [Chloroflexota bacterium]|tara:strand:- start:7237 stop:7641 length:405 start_codon:yes stop_codon:yes gene_type:complete